ncbi:hypothetical protein [Escherichia coli]|uniref:hypothetical protein n=1 Tax=Escherichia coli TaxID=562 RepID=UPI000AFBFB77
MGALPAVTASSPVPLCLHPGKTDGTFAITAVQHVPEKEAIVDNGRTLTATRAAP